MKKLLNRARVLKAVAIGAAMTVFFAVPAFATTSTTDPVKTAVEPLFTDLKGFAVDLIPLALGVAIVTIGYRMAKGWLRGSKG